MQLEFLSSVKQQGLVVMLLGARQVPIRFVRSHAARRYILRVQPDGSIRATVPRRGSMKEASAFAERSVHWIEKQLQKRPEHPVQSRE